MNVTIIEEHLCRVIGLGELISIGSFLTLLYIGVFLLIRLHYKYNGGTVNKKNIEILVCSIILILLYVGYWIVGINHYNTTHMEYTVIADDSVGLNEFYEKYEIISVDGNTFRVIEK